MEEPKPPAIRVRDPLSDVTRRERRSLLATSLLLVAIVKSGFVPEKISALGIEFSKGNQRWLLVVLGLVTLYFAMAFMIYAASDFVAWRLALLDSQSRIHLKRRKRIKAIEEPTVDEAILDEFYIEHGAYMFGLSRRISIVRGTFEFLLPLAFAVYAIITLFRANIF